jgi:outer membrane protein assembly factor BamB
MKNVPFLFCFFLFLNCHKEPLPPVQMPPPVAVESKLKILWQVPVTPDTSGEHTTKPQCLVNGNIVFTSDFASPSAFVSLLDAETGQKRWKFDNFILPIDGFTNYNVFSVQNKVIVNAWHRTYSLDVQTGNLDWSIDVSADGAGEPRITTIGDYIYKFNYTGTKPHSTSESLVRTHYLLGRWDTLLTITAEDSFHLNLSPPSLWINPQGDSILILRDNGLRYVLATPHEGRYNLVNLYAWNMRTRQYEWQLKDFINSFSVSSHPPIIEGNKMYLRTRDHLSCLDLATGDVIWSMNVQPGDMTLSGGMVMHENYLIGQGSNNGMRAVDKNLVYFRWTNSETIGSATKVNYFDGIVYYTSTGNSSLWAVDANNGDIIWNEFSPNVFNQRTRDAGFDFADVVIDPVRRVLYTADRYYMMCIQLPD